MSDHYPLVLVTWVDCTTFHGWHSTKTTLEFTPDECQTAGFLIKDDEKYLTIAPSLSEDGAATLDPMVVPKSWVSKMETLALAASCKCEQAPAPQGNFIHPIDCKCEGVGLHGQQAILETARDKYWAGTAKEEDCWDAPDPEEEGIVVPAGNQVVLEIKGDEALDRPLTLDEHIRRGGAYSDWPGHPFNVGKMMTHYVGDSCNPPHEEFKEKE